MVRRLSPDRMKGPMARPTLSRTDRPSRINLTGEKEDQEVVPPELVLKQ